MLKKNKENNVDDTSHTILRSILEGTVAHTGEHFFQALVKKLAETLHTKGAWVTEYLEEQQKLKSLAFWMDDHYVDEYEYHIPGTPCERVVKSRELFHVSENVIELFPADPDLEPFGAVSYLGAPMLDLDGNVLGHLAVQDTHPMPEHFQNMALFRIFADRASSELRRLRTEKKLREREEQLNRLFDGVMDAIIEMNSQLTIIQANTAAQTLFENSKNQIIIGRSFERYLQPTSAIKLKNLMASLQTKSHGKQFIWVPGGFRAITHAGKVFQSEATLSCYENNGNFYFDLVLRNVTDRLEAEQRIDMLSAETQYLRDEIRKIHQFDTIVGKSNAIQTVLDQILQVADTDAAVLITGETGTGKELVARAIHDQSRRSRKPLIRVNCAAIPASLIESEFFGHEKGAFTGATEKRRGRFSLADGGTIFLDEIGELPLELQPKLLRVLQEGEFEPVGSSQTTRVNVRLIAATNRNLSEMVKRAVFREDLYYRLHVFPINVPPLRERENDVILLAETFIEQFLQKTGKNVNAMSKEDIQHLKAYDWPGNIRELQNIIERAIITSRDGKLNLFRLIPNPGNDADATSDDITSKRIFTASEMRQMEKNNLIRALEATNWKVSGKKGASNLVRIPATTFTSRMKALGITPADQFKR